MFYLVLSTLRILSKNTKFRFISSSLYHLQQIIIPSLLILHLSVFSPPTSTYSSLGSDPLSPTHTFTGSEDSNVIAPIPSSQQFQYEVVQLWLRTIEPWRWFVKNATPLFTTLEGFCTLLVLQTLGRLTSWLARTKSDSWIIVQLLASSCTISSSLYFLYRIYTFPVTISLVSATLIGVVLTIAAIISLYGIVSGRGNMVESSLLFAYIVYCLYFTFTDFQSSFSASTFLYFFSSSTRPDIPPLPPIIIDGYTNLVSTVAALVPTSFKTVFQFLHGAVSTVTPSVFVSLSYRLTVFFAATRIVPAVQEASYSRRNSVVNLTIDTSDAKSPLSRARYEALDQDDRDYDEDLITGEDDDQTTVGQDDVFTSSSSISSAATLTPSPIPQPAHSKTQTFQSLILSCAPCILIAVYTHLLIQHLSLFNTINATGNDSAASLTASPYSASASASTIPNSAYANSFQSPQFNTSPEASSIESLHNATTAAVWTWSQGWANPRDSWQFWGWVNMFSTLFLYSLELIYGGNNNRDEIIEQHWKTD